MRTAAPEPYAEPPREEAPAPLSVSIIIPAFNAERFVADALRSVLAQEHPSAEIIVVDDGSSDGTVKVAASVAPDADIVCQPNLGAAAARNRGIARARGKLIAFLDADDVWFPGKLSAQVRYLDRHPDVGFCFTGWLVGESLPEVSTLEMRASIEKWPAEDVEDVDQSGWLYTKLLIDTIFNTSTMLIRREVIEQTGRFREDLARGQDYDYWLRMSRIARGAKLARPFALYRQHAQNSVRIPQARNFALEILSGALETWGPTGPDGSALDQRTVQQALARRCLEFAWLHATSGEPSIAFRSAITAVTRSPGDVTTAWAAFKIAARATGRMALGIPRIESDQ